MDLRRLSKAVLLNSEGKVLVLRRSKTALHRPQGLDFPGGNVDDGEDFHQAGIREIKEEVGISLTSKDLKVQFAKSTIEHGANVIRHLYMCQLNHDPEVVLSFEHDKFWWMEPQKAADEFGHSVWSEGLQYLIDNKLI